MYIVGDALDCLQRTRGGRNSLEQEGKREWTSDHGPLCRRGLWSFWKSTGDTRRQTEDDRTHQFKCPVCSKLFPRKRGLSEHLSNIHGLAVIHRGGNLERLDELRSTATGQVGGEVGTEGGSDTLLADRRQRAGDRDDHVALRWEAPPSGGRGRSGQSRSSQRTRSRSPLRGRASDAGFRMERRRSGSRRSSSTGSSSESSGRARSPSVLSQSRRKMSPGLSDYGTGPQILLGTGDDTQAEGPAEVRSDGAGRRSVSPRQRSQGRGRRGHPPSLPAAPGRGLRAKPRFSLNDPYVSNLTFCMPDPIPSRPALIILEQMWRRRQPWDVAKLTERVSSEFTNWSVQSIAERVAFLIEASQVILANATSLYELVVCEPETVPGRQIYARSTASGAPELSVPLGLMRGLHGGMLHV